MDLAEGVLYKFETQHCTVCKIMEPLWLNFLNTNPDVEGLKIDASKELYLSEKYGVSALPAFIYLNKDGIQMLSGIAEEKDFNKFTKKFLKSL